MSIQSPWPLPPRLVGSDDAEAVTRWHLRIAIACTEDGQVISLANQIGVTPASLYKSVHRGRCTHDLAIRLEKRFGREFFPRELFAPEPELPGAE